MVLDRCAVEEVSDAVVLETLTFTHGTEIGEERNMPNTTYLACNDGMKRVLEAVVKATHGGALACCSRFELCSTNGSPHRSPATTALDLWAAQHGSHIH
jgi:hypothetical protein